MNTTLPSYSTRQLTYKAAEKLFTCEASDLRALAAGPLFGQVYQDACDEGLMLVSHRTGHSIEFAVTHTEHRNDGDDETLWWILKPARPRDLPPHLRGVRLQIFND